MTTSTPSTAGILLDLAAALPDGSALAARARRLARRLAHGASTSRLRNAAADCLARLLDRVDVAPADDLDLLDPEFDR